MINQNDLLYQIRYLVKAGHQDAFWKVVGSKGRLFHEKQAYSIRAFLIHRGIDADVFSMGKQ
jgi:hypothetical protein|tara:strand:- start:24 stop:209 length:186 start_codon:yes stop_codon:yes gene_type:complete